MSRYGRRDSILSTFEEEIALTQSKNGEEERYVTDRFPFYEEMTQRAVLASYHSAVEYLFEVVPVKQQLAVLGRFNRKLVKRIEQLKKERDKEHGKEKPRRLR